MKNISRFGLIILGICVGTILGVLLMAGFGLPAFVFKSGNYESVSIFDFLIVLASIFGNLLVAYFLRKYLFEDIKNEALIKNEQKILLLKDRLFMKLGLFNEASGTNDKQAILQDLESITDKSIDAFGYQPSCTPKLEAIVSDIKKEIVSDKNNQNYKKDILKLKDELVTVMSECKEKALL